MPILRLRWWLANSVSFMTEPTPPDGHQPALPPRFPEQAAPRDFTGEPDESDTIPDASATVQRAVSSVDDTPPRSERPGPPADPTTVFGASNTPAGGPLSSGSQPPAYGGPPPPAYGAQPPTYGGTPPPAYGAQPPASGSQPPAYGSQPPAYGGPPPGYGGPGGPVGPTGPGGPGASDGGPKKRSGVLVAGLVALVVALIGALTFVVTQIGGDDSEADRDRDRDEEESEDTEPEDTEPDETVVSTVTDTVVAADGSVDGVFVRIEARSELIADADIQPALQQIGEKPDDNPVSTTDDVLNLCAAIPIDSPVNASVEWFRDNESVSTGVSRRMETPADGNCINNNGEPLAAGSYEVKFTDDAGGITTVALFTVGAGTRSQTFVNNTGQELCSIDVSPTTAGFYQSFELTTGEPLADGESIDIDVAEVEQEGRGIDCNEDPLTTFVFTPADGEIGLSDGLPIVAVPETTEPPAEITDLELSNIEGGIGSLNIPVTTDEEIAAVIDVLLTAEERLPIATTDTSLALCVAWTVDGPLVADIVWEFNKQEVTRIPSQPVDGRIGTCVPPGSDSFQEGAYQAYLQRGDFISPVQTFTVGREETLLSFVNDTGVEICEVGFSPSLTNFYTFYSFGDSTEFEAPLALDEGFTIAAPFIENDIKARDCAGEDVSEAFTIPPTDQTLNLTTGRP
jgi:hypothetical protein